MKHTDAIKRLKETIKTLSERKKDFRRIILERKFDAEGKRRPETGPMRSTLKNDYDWTVRRFIRANLIAYGLLRGKPYKTIERSSADPAYSFSFSVMKAMHDAFGDNKELKDEWPHDRVLSLIAEGKDLVPAPQPTPEPEPKGLLSRVLGTIL